MDGPHDAPHDEQFQGEYHFDEQLLCGPHGVPRGVDGPRDLDGPHDEQLHGEHLRDEQLHDEHAPPHDAPHDALHV